MKNGIHGGDIYRNNVDFDFSVNVNPLGICEEVIDRIKIKTELCARYPDINQEKLRGAIARREQVLDSQVICGNGASELLVAIAHALRPDYVLLPVPSFLGYEKLAEVVEASAVFLQLKEEQEFLMDDAWVDRLENRIQELHIRESRMENGTNRKGVCEADVDLHIDSSAKLVLVLANPNNPTGQLIPEYILKRILNVCMKYGVFVVLDECFIEFVKDYQALTMVKELRRYPKLMILRAFTKYFAMPGLRLGYLLCSNMEIINKIQKQLPEWNVSLLAQEAGLAAIENEAEYRGTSELIERERHYMIKQIGDMFEERNQELLIFSSSANFLLLKTELPLYELLLEQRILIRNCNNYRSLGQGFYRIAVRTHEENEVLIERLKEALLRERT